MWNNCIVLVIPRQQPSQSHAPSSNIEEFQPEDELDAGFLDEESSAREKSKGRHKSKQKSVDIAETPSESSDESDRYVYRDYWLGMRYIFNK